ncbi:N-alpha-acetyltransferase 10/11 [Nematocida ausubeli]|nr:N-alpha-acetyltransferase 10/11 [Nematocida ausubeli]
MRVRLMTIRDVYYVKECNRKNLSENYHLLFLTYMVTMYSESCFVAENKKGEIVGYSIAKLKDYLEKDEVIPTDAISGYMLSVAVDKAYRNRGLGKILFAAALHGIIGVLRRKTSSFKVYLNVRPTNISAINMYESTFHFTKENEEESYYADKENAFLMSRVFSIDEGK